MRSGRPMTGQAGQFTDALLTSVEWPRSQCFATNLLCSWIREPTMADVDACWPRFCAEMGDLKPKVIVAMGALPSEKLTGMRVTKAEGSCIWSDQFNCWILVTYQPAAALQKLSGRGVGPSVVADLVRDFRKIEYIKDKPRDFGDVPWELVETVETAATVLDYLRKQDYPAIDIETKWDPVAKVYLDDIRCLSVSDGVRSWVFTESVCEGLGQSAWAHETKWVTQNGVLFDGPMIKKDLGVTVRVAEDVMLMDYSLDERGGGGDEGGALGDVGVGVHGLKRLAREYCGADFYDVDTKTATDEQLFPYNAKDAAYTSRLAQLLKPRQEAEGRTRQMYLEYLMPAARVFAAQRPHGVYMNPMKIAQLAVEWGERWLDMDEWLCTQATALGWTQNDRINLNSPIQLKKFLNDQLKLGVTDTKADTLKEFKTDDSPAGKWVAEYQSWKRMDKMLNTYVIGLDKTLDAEGYAHPDVFVHGTTSGRVTYHRPPLQTMPTAFQYYDPNDANDPRIEAEIREFRQIRGLVGAKPPHVYIEADYAQAELWKAALLSNDDLMLEDLQEDFHTRASEFMWDIDHTKYGPLQWSQIRRESKYITFGVLFFRSGKSLKEPGPGQQGELTKYSLAECNTFVRRWHERYDDHYEWVMRNVKEVQQLGYQESISGRRRRYHAPHLYGNLTQLVANWPVQTTSHDELMLSYFELWDLWESKKVPMRPLWDGHDAIYFEVLPAHVDEAAYKIKEVMSRPRFFDIGTPVDVKVGPNWGEAKEWHAA